MNFTEKAHRLIFNTIIADEGVPGQITHRQMRVNLIAMSRDTFNQMRLENSSVGSVRVDSTDGARIFGVRVAFADGLSFGEMAVAEAVFS